MEITCSSSAWWELLCVIRSAVPAPQVIELIKRLPPSVPIDSSPDPDDPDPDPFDEAGQEAFLCVLRKDPILSLLGLRPAYKRSLLKRLLAEVEARRLAIADALAEEYSRALVSEAQGASSRQEGSEPAARVDPGDGWLYKTFAYGPTAPVALDVHVRSDGPSVAVPCRRRRPAPPPAQVTDAHVAGLVAALLPCPGPGTDTVGAPTPAVPPLAAAAALPRPSSGLDCASSGSRDGAARLEAQQPDGDAGGSVRTSDPGAEPSGACGERPANARGSPPEPPAAAAAGVAAAGWWCPWGLVTLRVADNLLAGSTGCHEWEASFALAQWVLRRRDLFAGRRVLELGCGVGLVAAALVRAGAALVAATDGSEAAVANCAANLRLNRRPGDGPVVEEGVGTEAVARAEEGVVVCQMMWEEPLPVGGLGCSVVLASDVLYDPEVVPVFVRLLTQLLKPLPGPLLDPPPSSPTSGCTPGTSLPGGEPPSGSTPPPPPPPPAPTPASTRAPPPAPAPAPAPPPAGAEAAYVATLRRNPATLELFTASAAAAGLRVEALTGWRDQEEEEGEGEGGQEEGEEEENGIHSCRGAEAGPGLPAAREGHGKLRCREGRRSGRERGAQAAGGGGGDGGGGGRVENGGGVGLGYGSEWCGGGGGGGGGGGVCFHAVPALADPEVCERIVLHRITRGA